MKKISINKLSPLQKRKLKKGLKVRIKKTIEGKGANTIIVDPSRFNIITKLFDKDQGIQIALTPEELDLNKSDTSLTDGLFSKNVGAGLRLKGGACKTKKPVSGGWVKFTDQYKNVAGDNTATGFINPNWQLRHTISQLEYDKRV